MERFAVPQNLHVVAAAVVMMRDREVQVHDRVARRDGGQRGVVERAHVVLERRWRADQVVDRGSVADVACERSSARPTQLS